MGRLARIVRLVVAAALVGSVVSAPALPGAAIGTTSTAPDSAPAAPPPTAAQAETRRQMEAASQGGTGSANTGYRARDKKKLPGPNDPCHCGSGKKYKKCHMAEDEAKAAR